MFEDNNINQVNNNFIQNLILENRQKLNITGVLDVLTFDDQGILLETHLGLLTVKGSNIRVNKLNLESEEVIVDGEIQSLNYSNIEQGKKSSSFIGKLFK